MIRPTPGARVSIQDLGFEGVGIQIPAGATVDLKGVGAGQCPDCGRPAIYLDGIYAIRDDLLTLLSSPGTTPGTIRELALVFARAAETGRAADKVARETESRTPHLAQWLKTISLPKNARKIIFAAIAGALATIVLEHVWPQQNAQTIINDFSTTTIRYIERDGAKSHAERERSLQDLIRQLEQRRP